MLILEDGAILAQIVNVYHNIYIHGLICLIFLDIFSGILKSFKLKKTSSSVGLVGIGKHILVAVVIVLLNLYLPLISFDIYAEGFTGFMIIIYFISLAENWGDLGLPLPEWVRDSLIKLKNNNEKKIQLNVEHMEVKETIQKGENKNE